MADDKAAYTVEEFRTIFPAGRSSVYEAIQRGEIPCVSIGTRKFIPAWFVKQMRDGASAKPAA